MCVSFLKGHPAGTSDLNRDTAYASLWILALEIDAKFDSLKRSEGVEWPETTAQFTGGGCHMRSVLDAGDRPHPPGHAVLGPKLKLGASLKGPCAECRAGSTGPILKASSGLNDDLSTSTKVGCCLDLRER
eukprot:s821_g14.t1